MSGAEEQPDYIDLAAGIVAAYVSKNAVPMTDLATLIISVHGALDKLARAQPTRPLAEPERLMVSIRKSVGDDFVICLEDGRKFKSLKHHLRTAYDLSPDQYRQKWGLSESYPMVAPAYSRIRSKLAKQSGLGRAKGRKRNEPDTTPSVKRSRGRPRRAV